MPDLDSEKRFGEFLDKMAKMVESGELELTGKDPFPDDVEDVPDDEDGLTDEAASREEEEDADGHRDHATPGARLSNRGHRSCSEFKEKPLIPFQDDDEGFLRWKEQYEDGFIVNYQRNLNPNYLVLHRASCGHLKDQRPLQWTTGNYIKMCSVDRAELETWAEREIGGKLTVCKDCKL